MINPTSLLATAKNETIVKEGKVDKWGIQKLLEESKADLQQMMNYNPYYSANSSFILALEISEKGAYVLLKNGIILKLVNDSNYKLDSIYQTGQIPNRINIKTRIIDISCGIEHSLARGRDCKIYSWGINSYGQLGLDNVKVGPGVEITEPSFIRKFSEWKINKIYATGYNSFCFDENNVMFGFGRNDQGQIKLTGGDTKISIPEMITDITFEKKSIIKLTVRKNKNTKFYSEWNLPNQSYDQNSEQPMNRMQFNEDAKLKKEIKMLKEKLSQFRKIRVTIEDFKDLINDVKSLIIKYEEKANKGNKPKTMIRDEINPGKNYDKQIEYTQSKKNAKVNVSDYFNNLDGRILLSNRNKKISLAEESKENVHLFSKNIPQISTLLERVNAELQVQKFHFLEALHKSEELDEVAEQKISKNLRFIEIFKEVIKEIESKIERLSDKDTYEEAESIKQKCLDEFQNFTQNTLDEITTSNLDIQQMVRPTLNDFTFTSSNNLVKLSEKIKNLQIHSQSNKLGKNVLEMFNTNILLAHQNNYLLNFILNRLVSPSYEQTMDKVLTYSNPSYFNEMKEKIEKYKNYSEIETKNANTDNVNYSKIEELNSDDENN